MVLQVFIHNVKLAKAQVSNLVNTSTSPGIVRTTA